MIFQNLSDKRSNRKGNNQYIKNSNFINETTNLLFSSKEEKKYFINLYSGLNNA